MTRPSKRTRVIAVTGVMGLGAGAAIAMLALKGPDPKQSDPSVASEDTQDISGPESPLFGAPAEVIQAYSQANLDPVENRTNARGQTYGTGSNASTYADFPDLVAVWVDPETIGFVHRAQMFSDDFEDMKSPQGLRTTNPEPGLITAYESDGVTVITDAYSPTGN